MKVLDTAGNLIGRIGTWGNAQTVPEAGGNAAELGFWSIFSLDAVGDVLYICDKDLRRIAKFRMKYRDRKAASLPPASPAQ